MKQNLQKFVAGLILASFVLAACAPATQPAPTATTAPPTAAAPASKVCEVTDTGGVDDKWFNQTAWEGAQGAAEEHGWEATFLESQQQTDYEKNINEFIQSDCELIVTVGFLLGDATLARGQGQPGPEVPDPGLRLRPESCPTCGQQVYRHRPGRLPGGLRGRLGQPDRQGGHLRRHQHPAGGGLHGRLRLRRGLLQ